MMNINLDQKVQIIWATDPVLILNRDHFLNDAGRTEKMEELIPVLSFLEIDYD
jgi:hypothetical protein